MGTLNRAQLYALAGIGFRPLEGKRSSRWPRWCAIRAIADVNATSLANLPGLHVTHVRPNGVPFVVKIEERPPWWPLIGAFFVTLEVCQRAAPHDPHPRWWPIQAVAPPRRSTTVEPAETLLDRQLLAELQRTHETLRTLVNLFRLAWMPEGEKEAGS